MNDHSTTTWTIRDIAWKEVVRVCGKLDILPHTGLHTLDNNITVLLEDTISQIWAEFRIVVGGEK
uniref:Uncharacterized protein n=1 Tax=viral metagenome TaxID=1070528 RepID=A0A6M3LJW9_9ZZZZ